MAIFGIDRTDKEPYIIMIQKNDEKGGLIVVFSMKNPSRILFEVAALLIE
mgnify:CR=1 FL=1